ncbi:MAG: hypothetical protein LUD25_01540, partial [Coriobacteriaceae bacterium]|nr:hypothetical protein [Coriobacteriaceae bacterium]
MRDEEKHEEVQEKVEEEVKKAMPDKDKKSASDGGKKKKKKKQKNAEEEGCDSCHEGPCIPPREDCEKPQKGTRKPGDPKPQWMQNKQGEQGKPPWAQGQQGGGRKFTIIVPEGYLPVIRFVPERNNKKQGGPQGGPQG